MLCRVFGCARVVFNDALRVRNEAYQAGIKLSDSEIQRLVITQAKKTTQRAWLAEVPSVALVQSVNDARRAWRNFFDSHRGNRRGRPLGRPNVKSKKDHRQSFRLTRNGFSVRASGRLALAKVGTVQVRWSRGLPSEPSSVTIIREPDGHYYASFVVDVSAAPLPVAAAEAGVDVGISRLATVATTDGVRTDIPNPKHLARRLRKLRRLERAKSRRQKGSLNRDKARAQARCCTRESGAGAAGLSPQSDIRRRPPHRGHCPESPSRPGHQRRGMGPVRADHRRESRTIWAHILFGFALVGFQQDMLDVHTLPRRTSARGTAVDVSGVPDGPRSRLQRRQSHSRRRAAGEIKRLPRKWARPRQRFRWSAGKSSHKTGGTRR
jgi:hypothetical protein